MKEEEIEHVGGCPTCKKHNGYLNLRGAHWFVCDEHKVKWCVGFNLFSSWRRETEEDWRKNWATLRQYTEVMPVHE